MRGKGFLNDWNNRPRRSIAIQFAPAIVAQILTQFVGSADYRNILLTWFTLSLFQICRKEINCRQRTKKCLLCADYCLWSFYSPVTKLCVVVCGAHNFEKLDLFIPLLGQVLPHCNVLSTYNNYLQKWIYEPSSGISNNLWSVRSDCDRLSGWLFQL